jgi:hypothetical protein
MKKFLSSLMLLLFTSAADGQTPMFFNNNTVVGTNTFPFANISTTRKVQWTIPANSIGSVTSGNNITVLYFLAGNNSNQTYPIVNIKLKTGTSAGLTGTGGQFETGMTTVFSGVNHNVVSTTGAWVGYTLTTPFLYDPSFPLLVEAEHNATSGGGQWICQSAHPGPGNGRQYGDYNQATFTGSGAQLLHMGIDVVPAVPCNAAPASNSLTTTQTLICPNSGQSLLTLANSYTMGGYTYTWQSSPNSVGPWTTISGSNASLLTPTLNANTYFQVIATCTNAVGNMTTPAIQVQVAATTTNSIPYTEDFEGIAKPGDLPNCSWIRSSSTAQTYTSSNTLGRTPHSGNKFASFYYSPAGTKYFYSNGIYLEPGITYSASIWYQTEYYGYNNWTDLSISYGPNQSPTGLVPIVSTNGPAISNVYKLLSDTFQVSTAGIYYMAVSGTGNTSSSAQYLTWDDLSVTAPCSLNDPTVSVTANATTVCQGQAVNLTATGADTYTWSTGDNSNVTNPVTTALGLNTFTVLGTKLISGCTATITQNVFVNPTPDINIYANSPVVCSGSKLDLTAFGAETYTWSVGGNSPVLSVYPTSNTTYTVLGSNAYGCVGTAVSAITVNQLPNVAGSADRPTVCKGEFITLTGIGANTYTWISTSNFLLMGNPVTVAPTVSGSFSMTGMDANGCSSTALVSVGVDACTGINAFDTEDGVNVYPNPTTGEITVAFGNATQKSISVTDITGRVIYAANNSTDEKLNINLRDASNGIYYVKIQTADAVNVIKVVKE